MTSLFISYARADDEPFAKRLHDDPAKRGFAVWWDRKAMESRGRTFLQEIRDAIEASDRFLAWGLCRNRRRGHHRGWR